MTEQIPADRNAPRFTREQIEEARRGTLQIIGEMQRGLTVIDGELKHGRFMAARDTARTMHDLVKLQAEILPIALIRHHDQPVEPKNG